MTWIAQLDSNASLIAPPANVAPGVDPATAATAMGWGTEGTNWRVATDDEAAALQAPSTEEQYAAERAAVEAKYTAPWNGSEGGVLTCTQILMTSALCKSPQDADEIASIAAQYAAEQQNMYNEFDAVDQKYGVE